MSNQTPPKLADRFLRWFCKEEYFEEIQGDLHQYFNTMSIEKKRWRANLLYWFQFLHFLRPFAIRRLSFFSGIGMIRNHSKVAVRTITKHKTYALTNMVGLTIGFASFIAILIYVYHEFTFDQFHDDADRIYRVVVDSAEPNGDASRRIDTPGALAEALVMEIPEIENATGFYPHYWGKVTLSNDTYTDYTNDFLCADSSFFDVFSFNIVQGQVKSLLTDPNSVVLTQHTAEKFFGKENPIGQILEFVPYKKHSLRVSAVIQNPPSNSHLQFGFLVPSSLIKPAWYGNWQQGHLHTYLKLKTGASSEAIDHKLQQLVDTYRTTELSENYYLQPLTGLQGIHLGNPRLHELVPPGNKLYTTVLAIVACFVLFIAGVNYVNLATAWAFVRAKEIELRKVMGATRKTIVYQLITESLLMVVLASLVALALLWLIFPSFNDLTLSDMLMGQTTNSTLWISFAIIVIVFGVASGLYPAFYIAGFKSETVTGSNPRFRKVLVVSQFALSTVLLISTLVVEQQMECLQNTDLGFDTDQIIIIDNFRKTPNRDKNYVVRPTLTSLAGVKKVGAFNEMVGVGNQSSETLMKLTGSPQAFGVLGTNVGYDYLETMGIELLEGRSFSREFESDTARDVVILNEAAVKRLGIPAPVIGRQIVDTYGSERTVIGVVRDFHFTSLHNEIQPFAFGFTPHANTLAVKLAGGNVRETIAEIEEIWGKFVNDVPMDFHFFDEQIQQLYQSEQNFQKLISILSGLAILISCLGLFGLVTFMTQQRTKEVGIRKVLGASIPNLIALLNKELVALILLANLIAWPIAYVAMNRWLENFAYRIAIGGSVFLLSALIGLVAAMGVASFLTYRCAVSNPVKTLRDE